MRLLYGEFNVTGAIVLRTLTTYTVVAQTRLSWMQAGQTPSFNICYTRGFSSLSWWHD